jgi:hypothetical protein
MGNVAGNSISLKIMERNLFSMDSQHPRGVTESKFSSHAAEKQEPF